MTREHDTEPLVAYENGATRSVKEERFDLLPYAGVKAAARRFGLGARKHSDRGWENGGEQFAEACINHLMDHAALLAQFRRQEDIDAVVCNAMMIAEFKARGILAERIYKEYPASDRSSTGQGEINGSQEISKRQFSVKREEGTGSLDREVEGGQPQAKCYWCGRVHSDLDPYCVRSSKQSPSLCGSGDATGTPY